MEHSANALKPGGVLMVNDYANADCPDVTPALNQFLTMKYNDIKEIAYITVKFKNRGKFIPIVLMDVFIKFK